MKYKKVYVDKDWFLSTLVAKEMESYGFLTVPMPDPGVDVVCLPITGKESSASENLQMYGPMCHIYGSNLLQDEEYTAKNGVITAQCAIAMCCPHIRKVWSESRVVILGWGRIGKALAKQLYALGAKVSVLAHTSKDQALAEALGYKQVENTDLSNADVIFNTIPGPVYSSDVWADIHGILLDLASVPGIQSDKAIPARGLPGKMMPLVSAHLIAQTIAKKEGLI